MDELRGQADFVEHAAVKPINVFVLPAISTLLPRSSMDVPQGLRQFPHRFCKKARRQHPGMRKDLHIEISTRMGEEAQLGNEPLEPRAAAYRCRAEQGAEP